MGKEHLLFVLLLDVIKLLLTYESDRIFKVCAILFNGKGMVYCCYCLVCLHCQVGICMSVNLNLAHWSFDVGLSSRVGDMTFSLCAHHTQND